MSLTSFWKRSVKQQPQRANPDHGQYLYVFKHSECPTYSGHKNDALVCPVLRVGREGFTCRHSLLFKPHRLYSYYPREVFEGRCDIGHVVHVDWQA